MKIQIHQKFHFGSPTPLPFKYNVKKKCFSDFLSSRILWLGISTIFLLAILPSLLYLYLGQPKTLFSSFYVKEKADLNQQNIAQLITKMQQVAKANHEDPQAWYLLGRLCFSNMNYACAATAFAQAHRLKPHQPLIIIQYAQSLYYYNHHQLNSTSKRLLEELLSKNSTDPAANNLFAIASFEQHEYDNALKYWNIAKKSLDPNSADYRAVTLAIENISHIQNSGKK